MGWRVWQSSHHLRLLTIRDGTLHNLR